MRLLAVLLLLAILLMNAEAFNPPSTRLIPVKDTIHGFEITDYFRWLEDKSDPDVYSWTKTQHEFTLRYIKKNTEEIPGIKQELEAYLDREYRSAPFYKGNREFFYARKKGEQQNKLFTSINGMEKLIFDPMDYDKSGKASIYSLELTEDGKKAAVGIQYSGDEIVEYRIIDTNTGKVLGKPITGLRSFSWTLDEKHAYITVRTKEMIDAQKPLETYLHTIGESRDKDVLLGAPEDAKDNISFWDDRWGELTFKSKGDFYSNTLWMRKSNSEDEFTELYSSDKFRAFPQVRNGLIYYMTNHEAPNFKIMRAQVDNPKFSEWSEFYAEKETVLEGFVITSDFVLVRDKKDVLSRIQAYDFDGKLIKDVELPEVANVAGMSYHKQSNNVFVNLSTFTSPAKVYKLDGKTLEWTFHFQDTPPIDTKDIESKLVFYTSKDSTKVPLFIIYKKGVKLDGNNPTLLYGYGGFNIGMGPNFIGTTASFVNRGGIYAIACIRGGDEYGESWHNDGMLFKKQNSFDDFIAAGEYLIREKYTNKDKLCIRGGSNGGLLIGAMVTQRPDLFKSAVCLVPLLDMLRYHKFLIARYWIPEYGDPDKKVDFLNILEYSPYHNIRRGFNYPEIFIKAGENDSRVDPLHAKKFAAALQNNPGQSNPVLLFVDFDSGHGSGQTTAQKVENMSLEWRFIMNSLGM